MAYLGDEVLGMLASVTAANAYRGDNRYLLPADTYRTAGLVVETLAGAVPGDGREGQAVVYTLPAWKLEALWDVLLVLRRTAAGDPDTDVVRETLEVVLGTHVFTPARTVERVAADLEKVAAVLMLDLPAVTVVATAVVLGEERGEAVVDAYREITAAWAEAGVRH
ncbi:hypothetical protein [Kitasatospora sp. NPDC057936]|uniref:hypothetical protein n=1 Tax=Kitasatospora sp. NPDC057936 TaxID=3346283 RepID=UPI0036DEDE97